MINSMAKWKHGLLNHVKSKEKQALTCFLFFWKNLDFISKYGIVLSVRRKINRIDEELINTIASDFALGIVALAISMIILYIF